MRTTILVLAALLVASAARASLVWTTRTAQTWVCSDGRLNVCASFDRCSPVCEDGQALLEVDGTTVEESQDGDCVPPRCLYLRYNVMSSCPNGVDPEPPPSGF